MKKADKKLNNMAIFVIVIMILFMSIISIEVITVLYANKNYQDEYKPQITKPLLTTSKVIYDVTDRDFRLIEITNTKNKIKNMCSNGCNLEINMYGLKYYYIIELINNEYILNVVQGTDRLLSDKNLGKDISDAYFVNYYNYILFYNIIDDDHFKYDYANVVDNRTKLDEFSSLEAKEMEFIEEGIIYYYDNCKKQGETNAQRLKAIRKPFSMTSSILGSETKNYSWCD